MSLPPADSDPDKHPPPSVTRARRRRRGRPGDGTSSAASPRHGDVGGQSRTGRVSYTDDRAAATPTFCLATPTFAIFSGFLPLKWSCST